MSHTVKIATKFVDLKSLKEAFTSLKWKIVESQKLNTYPSDPDRNKVYALVAKNCDTSGYDLGIVPGEKEVALYGDMFGGSIERSLGKDLTKLKKAYAERVFVNEYENEGYTITRQENNGVVTLHAEKL